MTPIICQNSAMDILQHLQEYLDKESIIGGIRVVDQNDTQIVLLVDKKPIEQYIADIWWSGYRAALT